MFAGGAGIHQNNTRDCVFVFPYHLHFQRMQSDLVPNQKETH